LSTRFAFVSLMIAVTACQTGAQEAKQGAGAPRAVVWPGRDWQTATPESQGLSARQLDAAAAYAQKYGGGSGCVIRHGYLVKEWGDPKKLADIKSATKGTVGTTLLGIGVDRHLLVLDDLAVKHYPAIGAVGPENRRGWFAEITIRHLATMTAGFDDSRPAKLVYRPGTDGFYSNDGSNTLAALLTLRFGADLAEVLRREVMDPIGVPPADWKWRENQYRAKTISGLRSREFASGITITHRALARIGYLYLREGEWNGRRILSREFVQTATRPTDLPSFVPYYAFFWGSNGRGTFRDFPRDTYWALGLGDSFVVVCPSLDRSNDPGTGAEKPDQRTKLVRVLRRARRDEQTGLDCRHRPARCCLQQRRTLLPIRGQLRCRPEPIPLVPDSARGRPAFSGRVRDL
jgi:CubicO group peptidase (beta-lactamase class C family)